MAKPAPSRGPRRTMRSTLPAKSDQVQSLTRALGLLTALAESHDGMSLSDLAELRALPVSTTHRLLTTLEGEGFVRHEPVQGLWQIGMHAFRVGTAFTRTRDVVALARPYMRRVMEATGETVSLYVEDGGEATCMAQVESRQLMRAIARPGNRVKLHCSGAGKAMLAAMGDAEVSQILQAHGLPRLTEKTLDTPRKLRADLEAVRSQGYAMDDEEHAVGLRCVGAAVLDEHRRAIAAVSLSGPMARIGDAEVTRFGAMIRKAAAEITNHYGGPSAGDKT
ncbi:MAG: IclR family transcriptional regulator C-terminal domain-containing protein [Pseudomonadota bacterium]